MTFRVLVCGGRDFTNAPALHAALSEVWHRYRDLTVIEGGAPGADRIAADWAEAHCALGVTHESYPAEWDKYGRAAGPIRNQRMLEEARPDLVLAFPGGKGTADLLARAARAGIPAWYPPRT